MARPNKRQRIHPPAPLSHSRPRELTPPSQQSDQSSSPPKLHDQAQSALFFKLSPELRLMIWEAAVGQMRIHVITRLPQDPSERKHIGNVVCDGSDDCSLCCRQGGGEWKPGVFGARHDPTLLLSPLMACRKIYSEAISILYNCNTFAVYDLSTMHHFRLSLLPSRWGAIRDVELRFPFQRKYAGPFDQSRVVKGYGSTELFEPEQWERAAEAIVSLKDLRRFVLFFDVVWVGYEGGEDSVLQLLEPLKALKLGGGGIDGEGRWEVRFDIETSKCEAIERKLREGGFQCCVRPLSRGAAGVAAGATE